jgi:hypothetical protein
MTLWNFFLRCGIGRNEASRRIARIGNALWSWKIAERDPGSETPNRSPAVLRTVQREVKKRPQPTRNITKKSR